MIIPDVLRSYTGAHEIEASGDTVADVFAEMETRFPGIRFRVINELDELRPHIKVFINGERTRDLTTPLTDTDELFIMQALSGG